MGSSLSIGLAELQTRANLARDYPGSFVALDGAVLWLEADGRERRLAILAQSDEPLLARFAGTLESFTPDYRLKLCSTDAANGAALRDVLPWLRPSPLGLTTSAGFGDRLGLATPGHVRALQHVLSHAPGRTIAPNFAQQSIREMERTGRTPVDVLTDATWGAFQAGWCGTLGADADHLKTPADIDATVAAGYSLYTLDPGEYVDDAANDAPRDILQEKLDALPWLGLESSPSDLQQRYVGKRIPLEHRDITLDGDAVVRAAVKYGSAVAHVSRMYRHIAAKGVAFELEVSVDETATPTSHQEHIYIARELQRLGVRWVSLAPRYVGRFEKGVDFIGSLEALREDLAGHAAIARALGPYKLSLHSGSDKFSVYPIINEVTHGLVHLKTAGTSYLEALRVAAQGDPVLFREILTFACEHYARERASYHVSADPRRIPAVGAVSNERLPDLLEDFDARQVLHVTFGSTLADFGPRLLDVLRANEGRYSEDLEGHFVRHLAPFVQPR